MAKGFYTLFGQDFSGIIPRHDRARKSISKASQTEPEYSNLKFQYLEEPKGAGFIGRFMIHHHRIVGGFWRSHSLFYVCHK